MVLGLPDPETMSLAELVAQMMVVRASGFLFDHLRQYPQWELSNQELQYCVETLGVGGVILLGGSAVEIGVRSQQLQSWAQIPLLLTADVEEGVGQRFAGATQFPPPMALSAIAQRDPVMALQLAEQMGAITAQEAIAIGLNWVLAPVVDVNNNANNPVINVRAFGTTPDQVVALSTAFLRGAQTYPVLTTAKHFPGHGDTTVDSHLHLPVITHGVNHLATQELPPFRAAIAAGVDTVMTAHLQVPDLDERYPATLSPALLTRLLRQDLGFNGLIVTDALIMGAITEHYGPYEAAVLAISAGADVLLMPSDPEGTMQAVCEAVCTGRLSQDRIMASVGRLWRAKQKVTDRLSVMSPESCHAWEHLPPPPAKLEALATAPALATATSIAQHSQQVQGSIPPCPAGRRGYNILVVDDALNTPWLSRNAPAIALPAQQGYDPIVLDTTTPQCIIDTVIATAGSTLLQLFGRGNPFRGSASLSAIVPRLLDHLQHTRTLAGLVVYGSPYNLKDLLGTLSITTSYGFTYGIYPAAQASLLSGFLEAPSAAGIETSFTD